MADSSFYTYKFRNRFPVSYLFLEIFGKVAENSPDLTIAQQLGNALTLLGHPGPHTDELLIGIVDDMQALRDDRAARAAKARPSGSGKSAAGPGAGLSKWIAARDMEALLLITTNFDFDAAYRLYSDLPAMLVDRIVSDRIEMEIQRVGATFESVVFGTGGSMKGGTSEEKVMDASAADTGQMSQDTKAALRSMGFM